MKTQNWYEIVTELRLIAQAGMAYSENSFDIERFQRLLSLASEITSNATNIDKEIVINSFKLETGYPAVKLVSRGFCFVDDKLLMVREAFDEDRWSVPGGFVDIGLSAKESLEKEFLEEAGVCVKVTKLIGLFNLGVHRHKDFFQYLSHALFICEYISGELKTSIETSQVKFFHINEIPDNLSFNRVSKEMIMNAFEHYKNPNLQSGFDWYSLRNQRY